MKDIPRFEALLKRSMGLDAASIGSAAIERAVQERMSACRLRDEEIYWDCLVAPEELQALVESVVVPETWFFRDPTSFAALAQLVGHDNRLHHGHAALRLLSIPCSTGEEPCSIAMTLLDAGLAMDRMHIDAVDISERALQRADRAVYGRNSFRGGDQSFRHRHFIATAEGQRPSDVVRRAVRYAHGNLLGDFLTDAEPYDVIFCRNLLIYFDRPTQDRAVAVLRRLLKPTGWLFVGAAETALVSDHGFVSAKLPRAFAFRKSRAGEDNAKPPAQARAPTSVRAPIRDAGCTQRVQAKAVATPTSRIASIVREAKIAIKETKRSADEPKPSNAAKTRLEHARRLADEGRLDDAAEQCATHLREHGPSAELFHLLGLVHDANGRPEDAAAQYRKALYLEPENHEALIHLSLLLQKQGDKAAAERLRRRASRLTEREHA